MVQKNARTREIIWPIRDQYLFLVVAIMIATIPRNMVRNNSANHRPVQISCSNYQICYMVGLYALTHNHTQWAKMSILVSPFLIGKNIFAKSQKYFSTFVK